MSSGRRSKSPPSLRTIADRLGFHATTVSLALRGSPKVPEKTAARIREVARELGYVPNRAARNLRGVPTRCIGGVVSNVTHPATAKMVELLYTEARKRGFELELHFHEWREDREIEAVRSLLSHRVDGLFLTPASLRSEENLMAAFAPEEFPPTTLFMHRQPPSTGPALRNARQIYLNIPEGCQQALAHLTAQGHRRIAVLLPGPFGEETHGTYFMRSVESAAVKFPGVTIHYVCRETQPLHANRPERLIVARDGQSGEAGILAAKSLAASFLQERPQETAILTTDDIHALALLDTAKTKGLRVPEDLSIISFGDTFLCDLGSLHLTHMEYLTPKIASRILDHLASGDAPEPRTIDYVPMTLKLGESVAALPTPQ